MRKDYICQDTTGKYKLMQNAQRIGGFVAGDGGIVPAERVLPEQRFAHQPIFRRPPEELVKSKTYFFHYYLANDSHKFLTAYYGGLAKSFIAKQEPTDLAIELMKKIFKQKEPVSVAERDYLTDYYLNGEGAGVWRGEVTGDFDLILISGWAVFTRITFDVDGRESILLYGAKLKGWSSFSIDTPFLLDVFVQERDPDDRFGAGWIKPVLLYKWVQAGITNYGLVVLETRHFFVYDLPGYPGGFPCMESFLVQYESVNFVNWGKIEEIFIGSTYPLETRPRVDKVGWLSSIIGQRDTSDYSTPLIYSFWDSLVGSFNGVFGSGLYAALGESYKQALGEYLKSPIVGDFTARETGAANNFHFKAMKFSNQSFPPMGVKYLWVKRTNSVTKFNKKYLDMVV